MGEMVARTSCCVTGACRFFEGGAVGLLVSRSARFLRVGVPLLRYHRQNNSQTWSRAHSARPIKGGETLRLSKREITDACALHAVIDQCRVVRIGAVDEEGVFVVPVNFGYEWREVEGPGDVVEYDSDVLLEDRADVDEGKLEAPESRPELTLYIHSSKDGRKARLFSRGANVAVEMDIDMGNIVGDSACAYSRAYRSIMGVGYIEPVEDFAEKQYALQLIMEHMAPDASAEFEPKAVERTGVFRIAVREFAGKERLP